MISPRHTSNRRGEAPCYGIVAGMLSMWDQIRSAPTRVLLRVRNMGRGRVRSGLNK